MDLEPLLMAAPRNLVMAGWPTRMVAEFKLAVADGLSGVDVPPVLPAAGDEVIE